MINVLYLIGRSNAGKDYFKNLMIKNFTEQNQELEDQLMILTYLIIME